MRRFTMQRQLATLRQRRAAGDHGFTMVELLVVVVIIGILVAIAIPVYLNYRKGAANKSAAADVRGAISAIEQYSTENGNAYPPTQIGAQSTNLTFAAAAGGTEEVATVSPGNTLSYKNNGSSYVICGMNTDGGTIYVYNSATGGSVVKSSQSSLANCVANGN